MKPTFDDSVETWPLCNSSEASGSTIHPGSMRQACRQEMTNDTRGIKEGPCINKSHETWLTSRSTKETCHSFALTTITKKFLYRRPLSCSDLTASRDQQLNCKAHLSNFFKHIILSSVGSFYSSSQKSITWNPRHGLNYRFCIVSETKRMLSKMYGLVCSLEGKHIVASHNRKDIKKFPSPTGH